MGRIHIPGLVDLLRVSDSDQVAELAGDPNLDRDLRVRGPLVNRLILSQIRNTLVLGGAPLPPVAPRGAARPLPAQAELETRLNAIVAQWPERDEAVDAIATYVRGGPGAAGPLAQQAVGRIYDPAYRADDASWAAARTLDLSANPIMRLWWTLTGAVPKARELLAEKVHQDPSGLHGTGVAVHNMVKGLILMRSLWADPAQRASLTPPAAAMMCIFAPAQVPRQPTRSATSVAGSYEPTTLVLLQLGKAYASSPTAENAFMTGQWSACPAHSWTRTLLVRAWQTAQETAHG